LKLQNSIRKQTLALTVNSETLALSLQPRLSDFNRRRFLPVIEKVLDEIAAPGRQIKIPLLDLDLGVLPLEGFEDAAAERLDTLLRSALEGIVQDERDTANVRSQSEEAAHVELLELYLLHGTLPFWAPREPVFSFEELIVSLMESAPQRVEAIIRRHGRHRSVLERLVLQLGDLALRSLLGLLEPQHATLILLYMIDLRDVHRVTPLLAVSDQRFARLLWLLVFSFLVQDAGSQFNRKSFVRSLIQGMAQSGGLDYVQIIRTLELGLRETGRKRSFKSSLPAIISELVHELDINTSHGHASDEVRLESAHAHTDRGRRFIERLKRAGRGKTSQLFDLYDKIAIVRYYLHHGFLPWGALVRNPALTPAGMLAVLPNLPRSMLRAVFARTRAGHWLESIRRAVRELPEDDVVKLLQTFLRHSRRPDDPIWPAIAEFSRRATDKHEFYARLIAAALDGRLLDLEEFASRVAVQPRVFTLSSGREAHVLKSILLTQLRSGKASNLNAALVRALVMKYPADAKHFLRSLPNTTSMLTAIASPGSSILFTDVVELLCPSEAAMLIALARVFARIPAPYRPQSEEGMRQAMLDELLLLKDGEPLTENFYAGLLRRVCGGPPPEAVRRFLLQEAETLSHSHQFPTAHLASFTSSLASAVMLLDTDSFQARYEPLSQSYGDEVVIQVTRRRPPIPREAVFAFLLGEHRILRYSTKRDSQTDRQRTEHLSNDALLHALNVMVEESPEDLSTFITQHIADPLRREHWARALPESALVRVVYMLEPRKHRLLLRTAEALASAWLEAVPHGHPSLTSRKLFWGFVLEFLDRNTGSNRSVGRLVMAFSEFFASRYVATSMGTHDSENVGAVMLDHAWHFASNAGQTSLLAVIQRDRALLLAPWQPGVTKTIRPPADVTRAGVLSEVVERSPPSGQSRRKIAFSLESEVIDAGVKEPIYINNAGLVLTGPFLPHLFQTLDMFSPDERTSPRLRDVETVSRAVHLLQYLVDERTDAPEPLLVLNKILCGVPTGTPVENAVEPTEWERESCGRLLKSMIANWKIIEHTSVAGLQQTFLQREGRLELTADGWKLKIQRKTVDVLVDQIPWSIAIVYHRWMPQPLYVNW